MIEGRATDHAGDASAVPVDPRRASLLMLDDDVVAPADPGTVILTCANCGAAMDERKCKLICRCGYFLSCSDYY